MASQNPKNVTIKGRLSFPRFTHKEAVAANDRSKFKKPDPNEVAPEFNLLLEQDQLDKLKDHILNVFLPYVEQQVANKEKRDTLNPKLIQKIKDKIDAEDWDGSPFLPMKPVSEKNAEAAPESVASVKITGSKGGDITLKARVENESQLDDGIRAMIEHPGPVIVDCLVDKPAKCFPMIPSGAAHTDMILDGDVVAGTMDDEAKALV